MIVKLINPYKVFEGKMEKKTAKSLQKTTKILKKRKKIRIVSNSPRNLPKSPKASTQEPKIDRSSSDPQGMHNKVIIDATTPVSPEPVKKDANLLHAPEKTAEWQAKLKDLIKLTGGTK